jgi:hypothetical protein
MILLLTHKNLEVILLAKKYVVFKDDDVGKDFEELKKWINVVLENNAKAAIGLIGKYMKNQELRDFLNSLNGEKIEVFCHGYSHSRLPFLLIKMYRKNRFYPVEFDRDFKSHNLSLKRYRQAENKYLDRKAITFGPPGNIWNDSVINALLQNDFKLMFSWEKAKHDLFTIPLSDNLRQNSLDEFIKVYEKNKNDLIYTLQFHHSSLSEKQFRVMAEVIDFLKNNEDRVFVTLFVTPSELLKISKSDKTIFDLMAPENIR